MSSNPKPHSLDRDSELTTPFVTLNTTTQISAIGQTSARDRLISMINVKPKPHNPMSKLTVFDRTTQLTHEWVNDVADELNLDDKHKVFQGLRATLQVLRDRLTVGEAANLGAELPILLAGFYYEGWKPEQTPVKTRSKQEFLDALQAHLQRYFQNSEPGFEPESVARAVFRVMTHRIPAGEMEDVVGILSAEIKELFPEAVRAS